MLPEVYSDVTHASHEMAARFFGNLRGQDLLFFLEIGKAHLHQFSAFQCIIQFFEKNRHSNHFSRPGQLPPGVGQWISVDVFDSR